MTSVAPLSYKSEYGYYGLRVNPTFEQVIGTVRNPLRIPVPERKAKWLALGPYRNFIEDAERAYNESLYNATDYRESGAHLPLAAARVRPSMAGQDRSFEQYHMQGDSMNQQEALDAAVEHFNREHRQQEDQARRETLHRMHGSNSTHPTIYAARDQLGEVGIHHWVPPSTAASSSSSGRPQPRHLAAAGHPQASEFPDFRVLNMGAPSSVGGGVLPVSQTPSYERMRDSLPQ